MECNALCLRYVIKLWFINQEHVTSTCINLQVSEPEFYDVIVLSLVINFEGDLTKRGDMLRKAVKLCKLGGHVFVSELINYNLYFIYFITILLYVSAILVII